MQKLITAPTIICRVGYCPWCAKAGRPRKIGILGHPFLAYGSTRNGYKFMRAESFGVKGFTPHIYKIIRLDTRGVLVDVACSMYECDVDKEERIYQNYAEDYYFVKPSAWRRNLIPLVTWQSLYNYKRDSYFTI